jgi:hypothetical protein
MPPNACNAKRVVVLLQIADCHRCFAAGSADLLRNIFGAALVAAVHHDLAPFLRQPNCAGGADT